MLKSALRKTVGKHHNMNEREYSQLAESDFDQLPAEVRNELISFHGKAQRSLETSEGFAGTIVYLDNGENVVPRYVVAKYPKRKNDVLPRERALRFLRELEVQAESHYHPNVHWPFKINMILGVPVAYFRRWEGDLSCYIEDVSLGDAGRLMLMIQLISGLRHCHLRRLIHQDLKPENVFVRDLRKEFRGLPDNDFWFRPMVADFGSVNLASEIGEFRGSRPYMAPEQWKNEPLGEWTSSFVVGTMLHEVISRGEHPAGVHLGAWHRRENPVFNRFQKNSYWRKWLDQGCQVARPLANSDLAGVVADCLHIMPCQRPSLIDIQKRLQSILASQSQAASEQSDLFLREAQNNTALNNWEYLNGQLDSLRRAIEQAYPS